MSRAAKFTLAGTSLFAISTVIFVHYAQQAEKAVGGRFHFFNSPRRPTSTPEPAHQRLTPIQAMHAGVVRDMELQRLKKERQLDFEMQKAMEEEYKKMQSVHDGGQS